MSHPLLQTAIRLFSTSALLIASVNIASAFSCPPTPSVLEAYDTADAVLIVRVLSLNQVEDGPNGPASGEKVRSVNVKVERVYKGNVKVHDQLSFEQPRKSGCGWLVNDEDINSEFLLYLKAPQTDPDLWLQPGRGRSKPASVAIEDLLYLNNMEKRRGKTRVSGRYGDGPNQNIAVAHRSGRIAGKDKTYETFTDEKGFFEIYDVAPGQYHLEPEIPEGWRIERWWLRLYSSTPAVLKTRKSIQFNVETKKHASINLAFEPDNAVEGRLVGPKGNPLSKTCAYLRHPDDNMDMVRGDARHGCADENGRFRIESIPPGDYVLVINQSGFVTGSEPFSRVFFPGTTELEEATTIRVALGQTVKDVNLVVPAMLDTVTVAGVLYFSDDQPVAKQIVRFEGFQTPGILGWAIDETDEQGRFSLKIVKGAPGKVVSAMGVYRGTCPALDALVKEVHQKATVFSTQEIKIDAEQDLFNLVLRLPIPSCQSKP